MKWISHIMQGVLTLGFLMSGLSKVFSSVDQIREIYSVPLGYDPIFIYFIGVVETIAAILLTAGYRWRIAAAVASFVLSTVMVGAITSHLIVNAAADAILPTVYLILLIILLVRLIGYESVMNFRRSSDRLKLSKISTSRETISNPNK